MKDARLLNLRHPRVRFKSYPTRTRLVRYDLNLTQFENTYVVESWLIVYFKKEKHGELGGS
jgi:hypothetical protein